MAFNKGSLGEEGKVKEYTDGLEGRIDSAFGDVGQQINQVNMDLGKMVDYVVSSTSQTPYVLKFDGGIMIVVGKRSGSTGANGSLEFSYGEKFIGTPLVTIQEGWNQSPTWSGTVHDEMLETAKIRAINLTTGTTWENFSVTFTYIVIGKWK